MKKLLLLIGLVVLVSFPIKTEDIKIIELHLKKEIDENKKIVKKADFSDGKYAIYWKLKILCNIAPGMSIHV